MIGDPGVIAYLQSAIEGELAAQNQYSVHAAILGYAGLLALEKHWYHQVKDERTHFRMFVDRMVLLGATPDPSTLDTIDIKTDVTEIIASDLAAERKTVVKYTEAAKYCESVGDRVSRMLFDDILKDEESHVRMLEMQQNRIASIGLQNYLSTYAGSVE